MCIRDRTTSAYAFSRLNFRGKNAMFMLAISTLMIPFTVLLIPLFLIVRSLGLADSLWGIIIPIAANGYGVFLMRQFFITIPKDLDESARIDGASFFTIYWRILLPLCKPCLLYTSLAVVEPHGEKFEENKTDNSGENEKQEDL